MSAFFSRRMMIIIGVAVIAIAVFKFDLFVIGPMVNSLVFLDKILFSNFGLAIIFFTVTVRLLMIPLTIMQTRNMRKMSALQPPGRSSHSVRRDDENVQVRGREPDRLPGTDGPADADLVWTLPSHLQGRPGHAGGHSQSVDCPVCMEPGRQRSPAGQYVYRYGPG